MREITCGTQTMRIRASNLARLYFYQEFGADLGGELDLVDNMIAAREELGALSPEQLRALQSLSDIGDVPPERQQEILRAIGLDSNPRLYRAMLHVGLAGGSTRVPLLPLMRIVWAMNKAQNEAEGAQTPPFDAWILAYDDFDFEGCVPDIYAEIQRGFFRSENTDKG